MISSSILGSFPRTLLAKKVGTIWLMGVSSRFPPYPNFSQSLLTSLSRPSLSQRRDVSSFCWLGAPSGAKWALLGSILFIQIDHSSLPHLYSFTSSTLMNKVQHCLGGGKCLWTNIHLSPPFVTNFWKGECAHSSTLSHHLFLWFALILHPWWVLLTVCHLVILSGSPSFHPL